MKIEEAVKIIDGTATIKAKLKNDSLFIFEKNAGEGEWFLSVYVRDVDWHSVAKDWSCLDNNVESCDLARVIDVIQRLLDTPVRERFPEKKYCLRWIDDETGKTFLGFCEKWGQKYWSTFDIQTSSTIFTESELEQLKRDNPHLTPAIDAMKEEVKDDE